MPQDESQVFRAELPPEGFVLESGEALPELHIRYETYGTLNEAASNTVWICSPLTADAHAAGLGGWWEDLIGPGRAIDTDHFFVVSSNILAGCQGTTGPNSEDPRTGEPYGDNFPNITIGDMVAAQKWLADFLGVTRLYAVIGGSMGGFQALKWAINYPSFVERCVVIASGARLSAQALGFDIVERSVILDDAERGLANARKLAHITYLSPELLDKRFGQGAKFRAGNTIDPKKFKTGFSLESYLEHQGKKFVQRFDKRTYLHITWAMDHFDLALEYGSLEKAFEKVSAEFLCVHISSDWLFPPAETQVISNTLLNMGKVASSVQINTPMGHDGFLTSTQDLSATVSRFLDCDHSEHRRPGKAAYFRNGSAIDLLKKMIQPRSRVLDLGCGDGRLIDSLWQKMGVTGVGVDRSFDSVLHCLDRDVPVIQKDLDATDLSEVATDSFDYVVLNRTLQEVRDARALLRQILRIAPRAIVAFPNVGNIWVRLGVLFRGTMPKSRALPHEWFNTPNIHLFTFKDFTRLCKKEGFVLEQLRFVNHSWASKIISGLGMHNLGAEQVIALVKRGK